MSVPSLPKTVYVLYQPLYGNTGPIDAEEAAQYRSMIDAGVMNLVVYEAACSWVEHGPAGQRQCGQGDEQARDGVGGEEQALPGRSGNHRQRSPRGQPAKHHQHGQQQPATASQEQKQICRRGDQRGQRQARATEGQGDPIAGSGRQ